MFDRNFIVDIFTLGLVFGFAFGLLANAYLKDER
jgi:hypothetical protein